MDIVMYLLPIVLFIIFLYAFLSTVLSFLKYLNVKLYGKELNRLKDKILHVEVELRLYELLCEPYHKNTGNPVDDRIFYLKSCHNHLSNRLEFLDISRYGDKFEIGDIAEHEGTRYRIVSKPYIWESFIQCWVQGILYCNDDNLFCCEYQDFRKKFSKIELKKSFN